MTPAVRQKRERSRVSARSPSLTELGSVSNSHLDLLIPASTGDLVGDEIDAIHFVGVAGEVDPNLVGLEIPKLFSSRAPREEGGGRGREVARRERAEREEEERVSPSMVMQNDESLG